MPGSPVYGAVLGITQNGKHSRPEVSARRDACGPRKRAVKIAIGLILSILTLEELRQAPGTIASIAGPGRLAATMDLTSGALPPGVRGISATLRTDTCGTEAPLAASSRRSISPICSHGTSELSPLNLTTNLSGS